MAVANDGSVVAPGGKNFVYSPTGRGIARTRLKRSHVTDVETSAETELVYVVGFDNQRNRNPVRVACLELRDPPEAPEGTRAPGGTTRNGSANRKSHLRAGAPELDLRLEGNFRDLVNEYRRTSIEHALQEAGGNQTAAAWILGIKRTTLNSQTAGLEFG